MVKRDGYPGADTRREPGDGDIDQEAPAAPRTSRREIGSSPPGRAVTAACLVAPGIPAVPLAVTPLAVAVLAPVPGLTVPSLVLVPGLASVSGLVLVPGLTVPGLVLVPGLASVSGLVLAAVLACLAVLVFVA